mgnify:CR=1 FL=1
MYLNYTIVVILKTYLYICSHIYINIITYGKSNYHVNTT